MEDAQIISINLDGIYNTVVLNDIVARKRVQDPSMLKSVIKFMFDDIGSLCTVKKIADSMTSAGRKASTHTAENYLEGITESLLMYRVGTRNVDQGHILENVVYLELPRRGYAVYIGKNGSAEVDFVVQDLEGNTEYYQVYWSVREESTLQRGLRPLSLPPGPRSSPA